MAVHLSEHFTYKKLFKAVYPSICMMIFTSIYSIVDGLFVSNYVGTTPFAALNLIYPVMMCIGGVGFMFGAGGSALVSKTLGEGNKEKANKIFSMIVIFTSVSALSLSVIAYVFIKPLSLLLGATPEMLPHCISYGKILLVGMIFFMLQNLFQNFFVVAEKPVLGFLVIVIAGFTNIILDAIFVAIFKWGLVGAAFATITSQFVCALISFIYFIRKNNKSLLHLVKTKLETKHIVNSALNGSSELLSNISASIISILFNFQLLKFAGENGVAAYGIIMYLGFIFAAVYFGYSVGVSPIIGYNYGAQRHDELKNLLKKSLILTVISGIIMTILTIGLARPLSAIFVSYDKELLDMTTNGMRLYGISFLICGLNIFSSAFFTSLNNGLISALISFMRTLVFQIICVYILPTFWGLNGIWLSITISEILSVILSILCLVLNKKKYKY